MKTKRMAALLSLMLISIASAQNQSPEVLSEQMRALKAQMQSHQALIAAQQAEISQLRREVNQDQERSWLTEHRASEIKSLVREVLTDADTRASLLDSGLTAGHNGQNFYLSTSDGSYFLRIEGLLQPRWILNHRTEAPVNNDFFGDGGTSLGNAGDEDEFGFEIARTKLEFSGHIGNPRVQYLIRIGVDREDNEVLGERVVLGYQILDGLMIWVGEDKAPFLREEITGPAHQLAVDRSLMNEVFTAGYIQGIWVTWNAAENVSIAVSINDGFRSGEADNEQNSANIIAPSLSDPNQINNPFFQDRTDFAMTARIDLKLAGDWQQWEDFSSWSGEPLAIFVGGAIHMEFGESGSDIADQGNNFLAWTIDTSLEINGLNLYAAFAGFHTDLQKYQEGNDLPAELDLIGNNLDIYGFLVQAGYMIIPDKLEPFIRFEWIDLDGHIPVGDDDQIPIITFGTNYYLNRHRAKITVDLQWVLAQIPDSSYLGLQDNGANDPSLGAIGLRQDRSGSEDQISVRAQFQVLF